METKVCSKCGIKKELNEFSKKSSSKDGHCSYCKECDSKLSKKYYQCNKERTIKHIKSYKEDNKEIIKNKNKKYTENNKEKIIEKQKKYYKNNKEKVKEKVKEYYKNNKEKVSEKQKKYYKNNKEKFNERSKNYMLNRKKTDKLFNLICKIRTSIVRSFTNKGYKKTSKTTEILGCTFEEFKLYIESQFEPWMNWDNYGKYNGQLNYGWDLDHIIPISSAKTEYEVIKLNHYTNFQPLCSYINRFIKRNLY